MIKHKDTPLRAEMGDKKYNSMIERQNKFYDKYKAGKRDPKTGEYYYHISGTDPSNPKRVFSSKCLSEELGRVKCTGCETMLSVTSSSRVKVCLFCGADNYFSNEFKDALRNGVTG